MVCVTPLLDGEFSSYDCGLVKDDSTYGHLSPMDLLWWRTCEAFEDRAPAESIRRSAAPRAACSRISRVFVQRPDVVHGPTRFSSCM